MAETGAETAKRTRKLKGMVIKHGQKHESTLVGHSTDGEHCVERIQN